MLFLALFIGIEREVGTAQVFQDMKYRVDHQKLTVKLTREARWLKETQCLARNIYYEARSENVEGQLAVAKVTLNRVESDLFPNTVCGVVNESKNNASGYNVCQFSWRCEAWNNPRKTFNEDHPIYQMALQAIFDYDKLDMVTNDTYWFHTPKVKPSWRKKKERVAQVDSHIFYKNKEGITGR